jgi:transcriptional regulator GlxA family with amidase domain
LLDEARDRRARVLLETTSLPLDAIARDVGPSGATTLVRASADAMERPLELHRCAMTSERPAGEME